MDEQKGNQMDNQATIGTLRLERSTSGTYLYKGRNNHNRQISQYVPKSVFEDYEDVNGVIGVDAPQEIEVTVSWTS